MILKEIFKQINKLSKKYNSIYKRHRAYSTLSEKQVEEIKIPVPWGHISGKWWGDKNVIPAIAIHGWQDNANSFDRLIPLLNLPAILAIDLPGHGYSSHLPPGKIYDLQELIFILHRIIVEQKWTTVPLITHSFGGSLGFLYSSMFPKNIKWLINCDCARSLLSLYRYDTPKTFSSAIDNFLKIEHQKIKNVAPAYKLSELIQMTIEGSVGSVLTPQSAMILLKRGMVSANESSIEKRKSKKIVMKSDFKDLIEYEKNFMKSISKEEQENLKIYQENIIKLVEEAKQNINNFSLPEEEDKYYVLTRDPCVKIKTFLSAADEFLFEASKNIKCPVLSMRASNGFLFGTGRKTYEKTLKIMKKNSSFFEHHEVSGTHHAHLNTPENLAPIMNKFIKKWSS